MYAVAAVGAAYSAYTTYETSRQQGQIAQSVANYNAAADRNQAQQLMLDSQQRIANERQQQKVYLSKQRSAMAAAGVLGSGSELDLLATTAGRFEQDNQEQWRVANIGEQNLYAAASMGQLEGQAQAEGDYAQGRAALIGAGASVLGNVAGGFKSGIY